MLKYGNNLGNTNLLILLQTQDGQGLKINFEAMSEEIAKLALAFSGTILVWFNEEDQFDVIVEVYPEFCARKLPKDTNLI